MMISTRAITLMVFNLTSRCIYENFENVLFHLKKYEVFDLFNY